MWPQLASKLSLFGSISRSTSGELFFYGIATPIDTPGESFWSDETQGLKQNSLFWAVSLDEGRTWTDPAMIPLGYAGSAEAPGPLCVTREGAWLGCYAPYNTFDPSVKVERDRLLLVRSEDRGRSWQSQVMTRFEDPASGGAEAWVVELAGGAL
ncbi:MAG: sialidase family protein, partial [Acidobacteria bacterium]|nr:sialidase family protein [Acidobacteriota bacterium]